MSDLLENGIVGFLMMRLLTVKYTPYIFYLTEASKEPDVTVNTSKSSGPRFSGIMTVLNFGTHAHAICGSSLSCKKSRFWDIFFFFHISAQNIDCGYTLEPPG